MTFKRIAIDTSKHIFTLHGIDEQENPVLRRELRRAQLESFFAKQEPTEVVLEACGGSHHWGRLLSKLGHRVRLIPPQYVKPFVKRSKNDRNDAEAISEAASRPSMRSVPVKTVEQQANGIILKHREMLVNQRTQAINALRGHLTDAFPDAEIVIDDLAGDGDHYRARIVAAAFTGLPRVRQHQLVYDALGDRMGGVLHALQLTTAVPQD